MGDERSGVRERPVCVPGCSCAVGNEFGEATAEREAARYRRSGPEATTRLLVDALRGGPLGDLNGLTVLDIGAGVGAAHLALLAAGAASAVDVDGSPAFVEVARTEAERQRVSDRVHYETGDFVELAPRIEPADLVVLDRVVCCYPDMRALVGLSAAHARRRYGLVYPRDSWWIRSGAALINGTMRLFRRRLRFFSHRTADVEDVVLSAGLTRRFHRQQLFWQIAVFERS